MKRLTILLAALGLVAGCTGMPQKLDRRIDETESQVSALVTDTGHAAPPGVVPRPQPSVVHEQGLWLGKEVIKPSQPELPRIFHEDATFDKTVASLAELAERLSLRSGMPVRVTPDALRLTEGAAAVAASAATQPAPGMPAALPGAATPFGPTGMALPRPGLGAGAPAQQQPMRIHYVHGSFKGLLDTAAARFGVSWKYTDGAIVFYHTDARTFQIHTLPGDSSFSATVSSGSTSSSGQSGGGNGGAGSAGGTGNGVSSNNSQNTAVASRLSVYSSMESAVRAMLSPYGKVVSSPATGSLTVVDTPDVLERVAAYIDNENQALARQVVINVTVLSVTLSDDDDYGINWNLVYNSLREQYGIISALPVAADSNRFFAGVVGNSRFAGSSAVINALSKQGKVRRQTTASVVTLNNQPVPVQVAKQTSYLQSSQTTTVSQVGSTTSLVPGTVTSGFNMSILPHVLANGTVLLQFSTDISALRQIREVQSGANKIETPEVDTRNFLQRVSMKSNETLIISGFEQTDDNLDRQGVAHPRNYVTGGGYRAGSSKESLVILITPTTLGG